MTREEQLAYAAGFVDGDGSVYVVAARQGRSDSIYYRGSLAASNQDERPIKRLVGLLGGKYRMQGDMYQYVTNYGDAVKAVTRLLPYLMGKQRQGRLLIELQEHIDHYRDLAHSQSGVSRSQKRISPELDTERADLASKIKSLNRGQVDFEIETPIRQRRLALAYLAGLTDAEGYLQIRSNRISLTIQMTDRPLVQWLKDTFGGWMGEDNRRTKRGKHVYTWRIECLAALQVLKDIRVYLLTKRERAELLILFQNNVSLWLKKLGGVNNYNLPDRIRRKRDAWKARLAQLTSCHKCAAAETESRHPYEGSDSPDYADGKGVERSRNDCAAAIA